MNSSETKSKGREIAWDDTWKKRCRDSQLYKYQLKRINIKDTVLKSYQKQSSKYIIQIYNPNASSQTLFSRTPYRSHSH